MDLSEAISVLRDGADLVTLAEAVGEVTTNPAATLDDLLLGLEHGEFVAEQAAFALHERLNIPLPAGRSQLNTDAEFWRARITEERLVAALSSAIATLAPQDRELLLLRYASELTVGQIAEKMGMNASHVSGAIGRAREIIRRHLEAIQPERRAG